ncbi:PEP-CTERM sorting domain-containing protein [Paucibacter sp. B2R-40]|nr:PEP-CTERM sorting domain-containing protein [Paucibacter sp. B2R-40]MCV2354633.1 PEP-CTERM sorting domain-containing protein [Paucibacter sp. B2R-40]
MKIRLAGLVAIALASFAVSGQAKGTWETTLQARDIDQDGVTDAYFDSTLNVTWLKDWNYAKSTGYAGANGSGGMSWLSAKTWAENLSIGGYSDWRLPKMTPVNGVSFNYAFTQDGTSDQGYANTGVGWGLASEIGHLYYVSLGHSKFSPENYPGNSDNRPFQNMFAGSMYWIDHEDAPNPSRAFRFWLGYGEQSSSVKELQFAAVAVRDGDVAAVPEPQTYALMLAGLGLIAGIARRRTKQQ